MYGSTLTKSPGDSSRNGAACSQPVLCKIDDSHTKEPKPHKKINLRKELTIVSGTALILNQSIGSGIFISSSNVLKYSRSFGLTLVLWAVGGLIVYGASLCYLELALLVKKSGSTYIYIKEAYSFGRRKPWMDTFGSLCGFLIAWVAVIIIEPVAIAITLMTLGRYICQPFFIDCPEMPISAVKMFALCALVLLSMVNVYSVKLSAWLLTWLSSLKVLVLGLTIILGIWKLIQHKSFPEDSHHPFEGSTTSWSDIALASYGVLWAYDGWSAGVMVQEETKKVTWTVTWMIYISMPIVAVLYILVNISFFAVLSYDQMLSTKAVGLTFGNAIFGKAGLAIFSVMVAVLTLGSSHASLFGISRELFVSSREGSMPRFISGIHVSYRTPVIAIIIETFLASILIAVGNIDGFISAFNAMSWLQYGAAIFGIIIMRITCPDQPRPYKVLLLFPSVLVVISLLLVVLPLWQDPLPQLLAFAGTLLGIPVYFFLIMEEPRKLRPKVMDRLSLWLINVTSKLFNTELSE